MARSCETVESGIGKDAQPKPETRNPKPDPRLLVVYPLERTRETPLTAFCLVDIMRNALGFGPCQYVLDAEKLGTGESATPEPVTHWVEKQFEKKPSKRDADAIREQLARMANQVKLTDARIAEYGEFFRQTRQTCTKVENAAAAGRLLAICDSIAAAPLAAQPTVARLAAEVAAAAEREDALSTCATPLAGIRAGGAAQDDALARYRMAARRLKQECRALAADAGSATLAKQLLQQIEQRLAKK
jgi:hypothetical protein